MLITGQNRTWQPNDDAIMTDRVRRYGLIGGAVLEIARAAATRAWRFGYAPKTIAPNGITKRPGKLFKHDVEKAAIAYLTKCGTLARA